MKLLVLREMKSHEVNRLAASYVLEEEGKEIKIIQREEAEWRYDERRGSRRDDARLTINLWVLFFSHRSAAGSSDRMNE